jgi:uncharacterized protein (DUF2384 family)
VPEPSRRNAKTASEKCEHLARVFAMAGSIWCDEAAVQRFVNTPHAELDGRTPLKPAMSKRGAREVEEVIEGGRHGLPL